jgi:N-acylglucosamine-6-phosphate 2-epimerase
MHSDSFFQDIGIKSGLIVSIQADHETPLDDPYIIAAMAQTVAGTGCVGLRINGPQNIEAVHKVVDLPIIGIFKAYSDESAVWITPTFEMASACIKAGASIVSIDATDRLKPFPGDFGEIVKRMHAEFGVPVMADVSSYQEGLIACEKGADLVATTLSGYTQALFVDALAPPDISLVEQLAKSLNIPVIAEGRYNTPELAKKAIQAGAYAVVVGSFITRPGVITRAFVDALHLPPS